MFSSMYILHGNFHFLGKSRKKSLGIKYDGSLIITMLFLSKNHEDAVVCKQMQEVVNYFPSCKRCRDFLVNLVCVNIANRLNNVVPLKLDTILHFLVRITPVLISQVVAFTIMFKNLMNFILHKQLFLRFLLLFSLRLLVPLSYE